MKPKKHLSKKTLKDKRSQKSNILKKYKKYKTRKNYKKNMSLSKSRFVRSKKKSRKKNRNRIKNHTEIKNRGGFWETFWKTDKEIAAAKEKAIQKPFKVKASFLQEIAKTTPELIKDYKAYYERNIIFNTCPQASGENCLSAEDANEIQTALDEKAEEPPYWINK